MPETEVMTWNLDDLYTGIDDPAIDQTLDKQLKRAREFEQKYKGKIDSSDLTPDLLFKSIAEYEDILRERDKPLYYATLLFSADTSDPARGAFMQRMRERSTESTVHLIFFDLELMAADEAVISKVLSDPQMDKYRHFVETVRLFREHRLSEVEERLMEELANTGSRAFARLFEEVVSDIKFQVEIDGKVETMTEPEILALLRDPRREVRAAAAGSLTKGLQENSRVLTFIFNTLVQDKAVDDRLRSYEYPEQSRHLSNELSKETVETVVETCTSNYDVVARYYNIKRDILGYDKLWHYDRYAPLFETREEIEYQRAKDIVLSSFYGFSQELGDTTGEFFDKHWIDAEVRKGKRGGAFCMYVTPDLHPYVLTNYLKKMDDVMTLGHELGHGAHASLSRDKSYLNFHATLPVAELASTFGEMLVFENLQAQASLDDKLALYAQKIEGVFATIFRQAAMYRFEQELHRARRERGELTAEDIGEIWQQRIQEMFGDSVEMGEEHKYWYLYVNHFINSPFYVYAYSFGELLVMALYAMHKKEGAEFPPKYIDMLKQGGALSPQDLLSRVGIDIKDPKFWQGGMDVLKELVQRFEEIHAEWKAQK